jgi:hypothetical protein
MKELKTSSIGLRCVIISAEKHGVDIQEIIEHSPQLFAGNVLHVAAVPQVIVRR